MVTIKPGYFQNKFSKWSLLSSLILILIASIVIVAQTKESQDQIAQYERYAEEQRSKGNQQEAAKYLDKIAFFYWDDHKLEEAVSFFQQSLKLNEEIGNSNAIAAINSNLGMIYSDLKKYDRSIEYFQRSLQLRKQMKDKVNVVSELINISTVFSVMKNYSESIKKLEEALSLSKELNNLRLIKNCYGALSENYEKAGNAAKSLESYNYFATFEKQIQKEELKNKEKEVKVEMENLEVRTKVAESAQKLKEKELEEKDEKLRTTESSLNEVEEINKFRQAEIEVLNKDKQLKEFTIREKEKELRQEKLIQYMSMGGFLLIGLFSCVLFLSYKQKEKAHKLLSEQNYEITRQKEEIQQQSGEIQGQRDELSKALDQIKDQNHKITSSITYAQRIQHAMLPQQESLNNIIPESFILFKPRDIVSGDFYWFSDISFGSLANGSINDLRGSKNDVGNKKIIIAAADCTGHGVPGAFMSLIGFNLLNEIIGKGIIEADLILKELNKGVRNALKQQTTENNDGMDMALCVINKDQNVVNFSGAKNPLYYIQDGEFFEIKGDVNCIGGRQKEEERIYKTHSISIEKPTIFYIFSDGFADQFGGEKGMKFMYKKYKELLLQIHDKPMNEQNEILDRTIVEWMGTRHKQIDDILVIGFKVAGKNV